MTNTEFKACVAQLATCSLENTTRRRDFPPNFTLAPGEDPARYDDTTLWYDAIWHRGTLRLICPRLYGLDDLIAAGRLMLDGVPVAKLKITQQEHHVIVRIRAHRKPVRVHLDIEGQDIGSGVSSRQDGVDFAGLNTGLLLSRNNDLAWIEDYARYHVQQHGMQAVLFFDNGSDRYGPDDILDALSRAGLAQVTLVSAPLPFRAQGVTAGGRSSFDGGFLQMSLLNIARLRFLRQARAVLQCDVDELVWTDNGESIFDRAVRHPLGVVRFNGAWRYPDVQEGRTDIRHADHICARSVPDQCPTKYCVRPRGPLFWASWSVHRLNKLRQRTTVSSDRAGFWHCRQITTAWKSPARLQGVEDLHPDPKIQTGLKTAGLRRADPNAL
ncbi:MULTISPECIES: hypothetical protein [Rhodobacterales]|uniref:hypothetical protein n=1 Tax=Rhodobacterales TaxID=204455 RepID=UPI003297F3B3